MRLVSHNMGIDKSTAWEKSDEIEGDALTDDQVMNLITALYEVVFQVDVDTGAIFAVNGKILDLRIVEE